VYAGGGVNHRVAGGKFDALFAERGLDDQFAAVVVGRTGKKDRDGNIGAV
jgi:hypothetical protein